MDWKKFLDLKRKIVSPSILSSNFAKLGEELARLEQSGADWVHVDVMDGRFVPNLTLGPPVIKALRKVTSLPLDVHLMIENPENLLEDFIEAGSDIITLHVESTSKLSELLLRIRQHGRKAGLTLRPRTSLAEIIPYLDQVDLVLVMTVEPGFGGQSFMEDQVAKIDELHRLRREKGFSFLIEVDGGINEVTAQKARQADVFVAGQYVFKHPSMKDAIQSLHLK
jgi:ribulose-phosphate 3-epimerase